MSVCRITDAGTITLDIDAVPVIHVMLINDIVIEADTVLNQEQVVIHVMNDVVPIIEQITVIDRPFKTALKIKTAIEIEMQETMNVETIAK